MHYLFFKSNSLTLFVQFLRIFWPTHMQNVLISFSDDALVRKALQIIHIHAYTHLRCTEVEFVTQQENKQRCEVVASDATNTQLEGSYTFNPSNKSLHQHFVHTLAVRKGCSSRHWLVVCCLFGVQGVRLACQNWSICFWLVINCLFIRLIWSIAFYWQHIFLHISVVVVVIVIFYDFLLFCLWFVIGLSCLDFTYPLSPCAAHRLRAVRVYQSVCVLLLLVFYSATDAIKYVLWPNGTATTTYRPRVFSISQSALASANSDTPPLWLLLSAPLHTDLRCHKCLIVPACPALIIGANPLTTTTTTTTM